MGRRGPHPTPTRILQLRGSRHAQGRDGEPMPLVERPPCPSWLTGEAKALWGRLCRELVDMGVLAKADQTMLALLCSTWGEYVRAVRFVAKQETALAKAGTELYDAPEEQTSRVRRAMRDAKAAAETVAKLCDRFGLAPSARPRLRVSEGQEPPAGVPTREWKNGGFRSGCAEPDPLEALLADDGED